MAVCTFSSSCFLVHSFTPKAYTPSISFLSSTFLTCYCLPNPNCHSSSNSTFLNSLPEELISTPTLPPKKFLYHRATPSIRWPHLKYEDDSLPPSLFTPEVESQPAESVDKPIPVPVSVSVKAHEGMSRTKMKKMNRLALKRAKDWRERCSSIIERIMNLEENQPVGEVLDDQRMHLSSSDYCHLVKALGQERWQRALDVFVWLNSMQWYSPNPQMLSTIIAVMGKNNQEEIAVDIFEREEDSCQRTVQTCNAMMNIYARNGKYDRVLLLFDKMRRSGVEPDLISFNILINARLKGKVVSGLGLKLLEEIRASGIRPDVVTYNTLISSASRSSSIEEAIAIFEDMKASQCSPDLWTYNAMIFVYGRWGMANKAESLWNDLKLKGFCPNATTYAALIDAFTREGDLKKVKCISDEMEMGTKSNIDTLIG